MNVTGLRKSFATSLRTRVLFLTVAVFVAIAAPAYVAFDWMVNTAVARLGALFAEKQVLFDRYRGFEALFREASLAETLSHSPALIAWARDEASAEKRAGGLAELERYRLAFKDGSYFFVIDASGDYYFNDNAGDYAADPRRYTLTPENPRDGWYFETIAGPPGCRLNVDHDDHLVVTKVWINCVIRDGDTVLGIVGTGIDLADFIREVVDSPQPGVESIFVDRAGAIQAHRDPKMVDFHSLTKDTKSKKTIFRLLDRESERRSLAALMDAVAAGEEPIGTEFVHIDGRRVLAGIGFLGEIGWFSVTLMDIDRIIDRRAFDPIAILFAVMLLATVALVTLLLKRLVLDRLSRLETAVSRVRAGDFSVAPIDASPDEIGRLARAFADMATTVGRNTRELEAEVSERTADLRRLAEVDPVTDIRNRRGFIAAVEALRAAPPPAGDRFALLLLDVDMLKTINDAHGHVVGDRVLAEIARRMVAAVREGDIVGRWGGDEFVALVTDGREAEHRAAAVRILAAVSGAPVTIDDDGRAIAVTASIGVAVLTPGTTLDEATVRADAALYTAKHQGRGRIVDAGTGADEDQAAGL